MTDTSDDSTSAERPTGESGERPAKKTAKKTAKRPPRKPAKSGAPRTAARRTADDRPREHDDDRPEGRREREEHRATHHPDGGSGSNGGNGGNGGHADRTDGAGRRPRPKGMRLAVEAAEQLVGLTGKEFEGIVGLSRSEDGWSVQVEVLDMRRIPSTTDVIAVYEVDVDEDGDLTGYRRLRRYLRGEAGDDR
jgi:hypothetical protein